MDRNPFGLTDRELEVLLTVASEGTNQAAANKLRVSMQTVKNTLTNVHYKTGSKSTAQAVMRVTQYHMLKSERALGDAQEYLVTKHSLVLAGSKEQPWVEHVVMVQRSGQLPLVVQPLVGVGRANTYDYAAMLAALDLRNQLEEKTG